MANYSVNYTFGTAAKIHLRDYCSPKAQPSESNLSSLDCKNLAHHPQVPQIPGIVAYPQLSRLPRPQQSASPVSTSDACAKTFGTKGNGEEEKEEEEEA